MTRVQEPESVLRSIQADSWDAEARFLCWAWFPSRFSRAKQKNLFGGYYETPESGVRTHHNRGYLCRETGSWRGTPQTKFFAKLWAPRGLEPCWRRRKANRLVTLWSAWQLENRNRLVTFWSGSFSSLGKYPLWWWSEKRELWEGARGASEVPVGMSPGVLGVSNYCKVEK